MSKMLYSCLKIPFFSTNEILVYETIKNKKISQWSGNCISMAENYYLHGRDILLPLSTFHFSICAVKHNCLKLHIAVGAVGWVSLRFTHLQEGPFASARTWWVSLRFTHPTFL